jgi:hypothetical protein
MLFFPFFCRFYEPIKHWEQVVIGRDLNSGCAWVPTKYEMIWQLHKFHQNTIRGFFLKKQCRIFPALLQTLD